MEARMGWVYLLLVLVASVWGFQPVCIKWLVAEWTPVDITFFRYLIMTAVFFAVAWTKGLKWRLPRHLWPHVMIMGFTGVLLNCVLQFEGLKTTTVTNCTLISAMTPALTAMLAAIMVRERLSPLAWLGIVLSFIGILVVVSHGSLEAVLGIQFARGDVLCFGSQAAWAVFSVVSIAVLRELPVISETAWFSLAGAIWTGIYGLISGEIYLAPLDIWGTVSFIYTTFLAGLLMIVVWNYAVKRAGASVSSIFLNLMPIVGMVSGFLVLGEKIGAAQIAGAVLVIGGVFLTTHMAKSH